MINLKRIIVFSILMMALLPNFAFAIPSSMNIQGKLTTPSGSILAGTYNFTFRIYDSYTGGNKLYETNITTATDSRGVYDIIIQNINLTFQEQLYMAVKVNADSEMEPRINLTSVPYTFRANISEELNKNNIYTVAGLNVTGNVTLTDKITFGFGQLIDNLINGFLRVVGGLNVTNDLLVGGSLNMSGDLGINQKFNVSSSTGNLVTSGSVNASGTVQGSIISDGTATITGGVVSANQVDVGGGFSSGGLTLQQNGNVVTQGDILFSGNITIINVTILSVNGSLLPSIDNNFDVGNGSFRWRNANLSGVLDAGNLRILGNDVQIESNAFKIFNATILPNLTVNGNLKATGFVNFTNNTAFNQTLYLVNGIVGIGTNNPLQKLEIAGNILVNNTANAFVNLSGPIIKKSGDDIVISD